MSSKLWLKLNSYNGDICKAVLTRLAYLDKYLSGRQKQAPWSEFASELYRSSDRRLLAKSVPTFADRGFHMIGATDPYGRILEFLDRSRYFFFPVAPSFTYEAE
jgi:hypothetical protein